MEKRKFLISKSKLILSIATLSTSISLPVYAANPHDAPRLVVGIIVEGLTAENVSYCSDRFNEGGMKRLLDNGVVIENVEYGPGVDNAAATAMLVTGALPRVNGIPSSVIFNRDDQRYYNVMHDASFIGNFTDETMSPTSLRVSTISDELRAANPDNQSRVYSISYNPAVAIIAGGHSPNSAIWINDKDGRWATSTYYRELPEVVTRRNYRSPLTQRLDTMVWRSSADGGKTSFRYTFTSRDHDRIKAYKLSPKAGDDITDLALEFISSTSAATNGTDMVLLTLNVAEYPYGKTAASLLEEQIDAYRRLDNQVARILNKIDQTSGLAGNTMVFVAGIPETSSSRLPDPALKIPSGEFSVRKAQALLNMYLMAVYGNGQWVSGYNNFQFYLNSKLAHDKDIDIAKLRKDAAEFLARMSGVARATVISDAQKSEVYPIDILDPKTSGDILLEICPGWKLTETDDGQSGKVIRYNSGTSPLYILYPPLRPHTIYTKVSALEIAPTLSKIIRIRAPNGASASPINLF